MNRLRKIFKNNKNLKPAASDDFTSASLNWLKNIYRLEKWA